MGILSELAKELQTLMEDAERLPYKEDSVDAIAWRYCRLLWQDKLQLELVLQLTRIGNAIEARNIMVRDALLDEPPREEGPKPSIANICTSAGDRHIDKWLLQEDDPARDNFNAFAREHNRSMYE